MLERPLLTVGILEYHFDDQEKQAIEDNVCYCDADFEFDWVTAFEYNYGWPNKRGNLVSFTYKCPNCENLWYSNDLIHWWVVSMP